MVRAYRGHPDTLRVVGCENLAKPYVKNAIDAKLAEIDAKFELKANMIIEKLWNIACLAESQGKLKDSIDALAKLGEHLDLFKNGQDIHINQHVYPEKVSEATEKRRLERIQKLAKAGNAIVK